MTKLPSVPAPDPDALEKRSPAVQLRRFAFISGIGLLLVAIILVTLYLIFNGGPRRTAAALDTKIATVNESIMFNVDRAFPMGIVRSPDGYGWLISGFGDATLYRSDHGTANASFKPGLGLTAPAAVVVSPLDKNIYVIDFTTSDPNRAVGSIKLITTINGGWELGSVSAYGPAANLSGLSFLSQLAFDKQGNLFVTATARGEIWKFPPTRPGQVWLKLIKVVEPSLPGVQSNPQPTTAEPTGLAIDDQRGFVYVSDSQSGIIYKVPIMPDGAAGMPERVALQEDRVIPSLAVSAKDGRLYFTQWGKEDGWLSRIETDGKITRLVNGLRAPTGLTFITPGMESVLFVVNSDLPGLLRTGLLSIFSGPKLPFTVDSVSLKN